MPKGKGALDPSRERGGLEARLGLDGLDVVGAVRGRLVLGLGLFYATSKRDLLRRGCGLPSRTLRRLLLSRDNSLTSLSF